jgi:ATP-dependent helicase/nuclease subunit B
MKLRKAVATAGPDPGPGQGFLDCLAAWWLAQAGGNPAAIADGLFLLPTRRAARGLQHALLRQADGAPLLLPRILALGALDEAPLMLEGALTVPPPVSAAERLAVLCRFILALNGKLGAPTTADRAWPLAGELAALLDEAARAEVDLHAALPRAAGRDFAEHWNVTLEFLDIVTRVWPEWLRAAGLSDVAAHPIALLEAQRTQWEASPPAVPIVAAGTTGAIPAVARLLGTVAHLPNGLVVLPGLDLALDAASWDALDATHPQASLRDLLHALGVTRGDVQVLGGAARPARSAAWRLALLPAPALHQWQQAEAPITDGMTLLQTADQQEEAAAIVLTLRAALVEPGVRAALVTPDRALAQRVAAGLRHFGIVADDSAGEPLADTPPAVFLRLLASAVAQNLAPVGLLSLLKHPLCAAGLSQAACRMAARTLELQSLRGPRPGPGLDGERGADAAFLSRIDACLQPLLALAALERVDPQEALRHLIEAAVALCATDEEAGDARLWAGEEGAALSAQLSALLEAFAHLPPQRVRTLPALLEAALAGAAVRSRRALRGRDDAEHPRIFIWGLLEARLQAADVMVLGGLLEGVWPPIADSGPWMNRAMRAAVGLPSPEEPVGLAAHDFVSAACAAPRVVLSVPRRRDGAPAVPCRWVVRLLALLQGRNRALAVAPAAAWSRALDRPDGTPRPVSPPAPAPPVALRPRRLRVTEVETWLRDPYAIYARHVLGLKKLDPLEQAADAADYGRIVHAGMHMFYDRFGTAWPADAEAQFMAAMDQALAAANMRPALASWWQPRLRRIAAWVADAEAERRRNGPLALIEAELDGEWIFAAPAGPFSVRGRADRIERRFDGGIAILDYKTGAPPTNTEVEQGLAPQLPLEAAMLQAGAFGTELTGRAAELTYWHISGGYKAGEVRSLLKGNPALVQDAAETAAKNLQARVAAFDDANQPYLSQPYPRAAPRYADPRYADYARLARVAEWAALDDSL